MVSATEDEGGLAGIPIKLRNTDGSYGVEEFTIEPDDYDNLTLLNSISRDVSFSAFGTDLFSDEVSATPHLPRQREPVHYSPNRIRPLEFNMGVHKASTVGFSRSRQSRHYGRV